ncbi:hypothetical protein EYE40_01820 [Glaciihabitans arcticus]|uniref:Polyketide antibiotic transporter n=1 Tax=Glaciihabitans arcticus TaxID=2668039 RepID=A0A4Q9GUJ1_9MICO|nr:ABC transporter permease subunit [Glaciihabitans arcticus]TBN56233.1 hypothetical protein EYE40_01820 [Glaciihabitans arcticus]
MSALLVLLGQRIRRDRWTVPLWVASTALLALFAAAAIGDEYGDDEARSGILRLAVANPAILMVRGLPNGAEIGQFTFFQIFTWLGLMAGLMSTFLAIRHTRAEEESGRAELVSSTAAGRYIPYLATVVHGLLANLVLGVGVAAGFAVTGLAVDGSLLTGVAAAAVGMAFLGLGLLAAQLFRSARSSNSVAVILVVGSLILRGLGDALGTPSSDGLSIASAWPTWLSPVGWAEQVGAFNENDYAPLVLNLALFVACAGVVLVIVARRDLGASLFAGRRGRATGSLSGTLALAWRLQYPTIIAWSLGGAAFGFFAGSLGSLLETAAGQNPAIADTIDTVAHGGGTLEETLITLMFNLVGILAAACAVQAVIRARQEEAGGTAELLLATPTSRVRWFVDYLVVGGIAIGLVLLSGALVGALGVLGTGSDTGQIGKVFAAAAAQLPAALVFLAALALIFTLLPAATSALGWSLLGVLSFLGFFGGLVGAPDWLTELSPFSHSPVPFGDDVDWSGGVWMLAAAAAGLVVAALVMRRRSLRLN